MCVCVWGGGGCSKGRLTPQCTPVLFFVVNYVRLKMCGDPYRNRFEEEICHGKKPDPSGKNEIRPTACVIL